MHDIVRFHSGTKTLCKTAVKAYSDFKIKTGIRHLSILIVTLLISKMMCGCDIRKS